MVTKPTLLEISQLKLLDFFGAKKNVINFKFWADLQFLGLKKCLVIINLSSANHQDSCWLAFLIGVNCGVNKSCWKFLQCVGGAPYLEEHYNFSSCLFGVKAPICNFDKMLNANYAVMILTGQDFVAQFLDKLTLKLA
jgi:hypothetical protein